MSSHHHHLKQFKQHPQHAKFFVLGWVICIFAALFYCYEYLLRIEPSVMVPQLMSTFHITADSLGFLTAMYYYAYTPLQAVVGVTTDYFGPKKVLTLAIGFCAVGAFIFSTTTLFYVAAIGRLMIGAGSAFAFVGVLKLAAMWLPRNRFAMFVGMTTALGMLGAMIGDVEMSKLVRTVGWHQVILGSAIFGAVFLPLFWVVVSERKIHRVVESKSFGDLMGRLWGLVKSRQMWIAGLIGCVLYLSLSVFGELWGIPFIRTHTGLTAGAPARINAMVFLGWLIGSPLNGVLSDWLKSRKKPMVVGSLLAALTILWILLKPHMGETEFSVCLFLFGLFSSVQVLCFVVAREHAGLGVTATAVGFINLLVMCGGMIFQPLVGALLDFNWAGSLQHGVRVYQFHDFQDALILIPICMVIGGLLAMGLKETYRAGE